MSDLNKNKIVPINYTNRDFNSIREALIEHARRYYPDTYKDFNEASFGSLVLDTVSYVGDVLSFYLDYQANESFLNTASEYKNVLKLMSSMGFKFTKAPASFGICQMFALVPSNPVTGTPDMKYAPVVRTGTTLSSTAGNLYTLIEDVDFSNPNNDIIVARVNETTGYPTYYAVKTEGQIISGELFTHTEAIGAYEKYKKIVLPGENVSEVVSVVDSDGNTYFEVEHLSQNTVFKKLVNPNYSRDNVPNILKTIPVPRRYIVEHSDDDTVITFGAGTSENIMTGSVSDPSTMAIKRHGKSYISDSSFDPFMLTGDEKMGVAPSNTTVVVTYRENTEENVNAGSNTINEVSDVIIEFNDPTKLDSTVMDFITTTIEVTNEDPILGDITLPTLDELKLRASKSFSSQRRAVTKDDYVSVVYSMPANLGAIKRCSVLRDRTSTNRELDMYVISEDEIGNLTKPNLTLKNNLKTWVNTSRMINDNINIKDAKIINFGIEFVIEPSVEANSFDALRAASIEVKKLFETHMEIGEPIIISEIFKTLKSVEQVLDVISIEVTNKTGTPYSLENFSIQANTSNDGRIIYIPETHIFELKYPDVDIVGTVR